MTLPRPMSAPAVTADVIASLTAFRDAVGALGEDDWGLPTDCPGWDVQDVVAHVVTFEAFLDGESTPPAGSDRSHVRNDIGRLNEAWIDSRRGRPGQDLLAELDLLVDRRADEMAQLADDDLGVVGWSPVGEVPRSRFLQVRVLDVWFHEQDIREATGRPGPTRPEVVDRVLSELTHGLAFVVGRRSDAPDGSVVRFSVRSDHVRDPTVIDVAVIDGRGRWSDEAPADPAATIGADLAAFTRLVGGRRPPSELLEHGRVTLEGDRELGRRVVENLGFMI